MSEGDIQIPAHSMGQATVVLADIVCAYVCGIQPQDFSGTDEDLKKYHQVTISMFLYHLLTRSKHKVEMAGILDALAATLRAEAE